MAFAVGTRLTAPLTGRAPSSWRKVARVLSQTVGNSPEVCTRSSRPSEYPIGTPGCGTAVTPKSAVPVASSPAAYQRVSPGPMESRYWPGPTVGAPFAEAAPLIGSPLNW